MAEWREEGEDMECSNQVCNVEEVCSSLMEGEGPFLMIPSTFTRRGKIPGLVLLFVEGDAF